MEENADSPTETVIVLTEDEQSMVQAMQNFHSAAHGVREIFIRNLGADTDQWNTRAGVFLRLKPPMLDYYLENKWKVNGKSGRDAASAILRCEEQALDVVEAMKKEMKIPVTQADRASILGNLKDLLNRNFNNFLHNEIVNPLKEMIKV